MFGSFDFNYFTSSLVSLDEMLSYARRHLSVLGEGSSRISFDYGGKCLKVLKDVDLVSQNITEYYIYHSGMFLDILPKVYDYDIDSDRWILFELARPVSLDYFVERYGGEVKKCSMLSDFRDLYSISDDSLIRDLKYMTRMFNLGWGDFLRASSFGLVNRGGEDRLVLLDFGLTADLYYSYYKERKGNK